MDDLHLDRITEEWFSIYPGILADLAYNKNLADHLVSTELMIKKFKGAQLLQEDGIDTSKWDSLGYLMLNTYYEILNLIPDFCSKQVPQLNALSRDTIKEERFHNDAILAKGVQSDEISLLAELTSWNQVVSGAKITGNTLHIILKSPNQDLIPTTAVRFAREIASRGVNLKSVYFYDVKDAVLEPVEGTEIFIKLL